MMCPHADAVPVESTVTGQVLAALCPDCDTQLPAEFLTCPHENVIDITNMGEPPGQGICNDCGTTAWFARPSANRRTDLPQLIAAGWDPDSVRDALADDYEALRHTFEAAQAEPYRIILLPSASAATEIS